MLVAQDEICGVVGGDEIAPRHWIGEMPVEHGDQRPGFVDIARFGQNSRQVSANRTFTVAACHMNDRDLFVRVA